MNIAISTNSSAVGQPQSSAGTSTPTTTDSDVEQALQAIFSLLQQMMQSQTGSATNGSAQNSDCGDSGTDMPQLPQLPPTDASGSSDPATADPTTAADGTPAATAPCTSGVPDAPNAVPCPTDQPPDPTKSAQDYMNANNGLLGKLGNQGGVQDQLKARYGDWTDTSRSPADRAQSAYNASRHVGIIKNKNGSDGKPRDPKIVGDGKMEGATKDGDIRDGTEMGDLKNSLKGDANSADQTTNTANVLNNADLKKTKDTHVTANGTNKDNFQWAAGEAGKKLWFIPGLSKVLEGVGNSTGGVGGILKGGITGVLDTWKDDAKGVIDSIKGGKLNPYEVAANMFKENVSDSTATPGVVKTIADSV